MQLTADQLAFALQQVYPVEATAVSQGNTTIQAHDTASVTFTGQEAVAVAWRPATQTVTDTLTANFTLLVTNTGNVSTRYDLSALAAALQVETEFDFSVYSAAFNGRYLGDGDGQCGWHLYDDGASRGWHRQRQWTWLH